MASLLGSFRKSQPIIPRVRDFDRNFILLGKVNAGKSTLSNLLHGGKDTQFPMHKYSEARSNTREVRYREIKVDPAIVYGEGCLGNSDLKVQIMDQPGSSDPSISETMICQNTMRCIKESLSELSNTFLIVFKLIEPFFSPEEMISILNTAEILSDSGYKFFENAILVVTHADKLIGDQQPVDYETCEPIFKEKLENEKWASLIPILERIDGRHLFINASDISEENRETVLKALFELSKPTLNVSITGNVGFMGSELGELLEMQDENVVNINSEKFNVNYFINPDLNIFHLSDKLTLEDRIKEEFNKFFIISKGISVMVILISLEQVFSNDCSKLINSLPEKYSLTAGVEENIWQYSFILFLSPAEAYDRDFVLRNIKSNGLLTKLVDRVNRRYTWVTRGMTPGQRFDNLIAMVLKVAQQAQGRTLINNNIVSKMKQTIKTAKSPVHGKQKDIPYIKMEGREDILINANKFVWDKDKISRILGYYIVKRINPGAAVKFEARFPDDKSEVTRKEFMEFCKENVK